MKRSEHFFEPKQVSGKNIFSRSIVSFLVFVVFLAGAWMIFSYIKKQPQDDGTPKTLRAALNINEKVFSKVFDSGHLVKEYPISAAVKKVRVNGSDGLSG